MAGFTPHTDDEIRSMLSAIGLQSLDELYETIPEALRLSRELALEPGQSEPDVAAAVDGLAGKNRATGSDLICFAGGGAYDHEISRAVRAVASRSEFVTAYTPYQPEVAQGVLQALFEYQTMVSRLAGLPIANASLYDGATALVEAVNLVVAATGRSRVLMSRGVHPNWRETVTTFARGTGHDIVDVPLENGVTTWPSEGEAPAALVVQYPNYLGCVEDLAVARSTANSLGAELVVAFDPVATGVLRSPGAFGADVAVAEGQPFGMPLSFGGPYLGMFACRAEHVRRIPGRLVGETVDTSGRRAYVTTLRAREQDIRREKASSNICTNQTLMAVTAAIHLSWLGTAGIAELAKRCVDGTQYTRRAMLNVEGTKPLADAPVVREFAVSTPTDPHVVVDRMLDEGFLAGIPLGPEYGENGLLVSVTERRTQAEIDAYVCAFEKAVR